MSPFAEASLYGETQKLRKALREAGGYPDQLTTAQLEILLTKCPDRDLALTAIFMFPRPRWLVEIIPGMLGAFPRPGEEEAA